MGAAYSSAAGPILAEDATVERLAGEFAFTEGPASDAQGNVYFTDQPNDRILKWSVSGELTSFMQPSGRANGLCIDENGSIWACADEKNQLWRIAPNGTHTVVLDAHQGKLLNGPNDLWIAPDGGVYFTDPFYQRDYWKRGPKEQECEGVYYLAPGATRAVLVVNDLEQPNGLIGTPDGKTLYVSDIRARKTWKYTVAEDGSLADKTLFCELGSDGMTIDDAGNVYLTGKGVTVFDLHGTQVQHIEVPEPWTANVCFGGEDQQWLFITASKGLYRIRMAVKGVGSQ
jgi:gluconolactonase